MGGRHGFTVEDRAGDQGICGQGTHRVHTDSVVLAAGHAHLGGEPFMARARGPVDDDGCGKGGGRGENRRAGLGVDDHHPGNEIARRFRSRSFVVGGQFLESRGDFLSRLGLFELAGEGGFDEVVGVLHRGGFRNNDQNAAVRDEEEVEHVDSGAGPEVEDDMICIELLDVTEDSALLSVFRVGHLEQRIGAADQVEARDRGAQDDVVEVGNSPVEIVRKGEFRIGHAEEGVEVGAAEIGINNDDSLAALGEDHTEVCGEDRFAHTALTSADRPDPRTIVVQIIVKNVDHCCSLTVAAEIEPAPSTPLNGCYHLKRDVAASFSVYRAVNTLRGTDLEQV